MNQTVGEISAQAKSILARKEAIDRLPAKPVEGFLVVNNSFLHRSQAQFKKADRYLAVPVDASGKPQYSHPVLLAGVSKIADFDFIPKSNPRVSTTPLAEAAEPMLEAFGVLAFVLLGEIRSGGKFEEPISQSKALTTLILEPSEKDEIAIKPPRIIINRLVDADRIWDQIKTVGTGGWELEQNFGTHLGAAVTRLHAAAHDDLSIPKSPADVGSQTLLDRMIGAFATATSEYGKAVGRLKAGDRAALNDIMRLAYNFSDDAMQLADFVTALSDLKPLVQLLTVESQYDFAASVRQLLRRRVDQKPSVAAYRETISDARSAAFHRLIPFGKAIEVKGLELRGARIRLFPEYESRKANVVDYEDRPLLELLTQMARPTVKDLDDAFWDENVSVMEATVVLLKRLRTALVTLLGDLK